MSAVLAETLAAPSTRVLSLEAARAAPALQGIPATPSAPALPLAPQVAAVHSANPAASATSAIPALPAALAPSAAPNAIPTKHMVHWFRKGLRLHDNPALREGLINASTYRCVFIIDPWFATSSNVGINKWRFLLQCLEDLDNRLKKINSRLFVVRGQPADALPKLFREWGTTELTFEEDPEPYGRVRDHNIMSKCREVGITVISRVSHTLYKLDQIIERNGGKAPLTYHQFQVLIAGMPPPAKAEPEITTQTLNGAVTPLTADHNDRFGVPSLEELGFETKDLKPPVWLGGETEALARLERHLERKAWVASFGRPKMTPQSLLASQTGLSPYLRFGCLSTRLFYHQLSDLYRRIKGVRPPLSLHGQILWREFFYCAATRNPNFDRMEGNPICVQIPWEKNQEALAKWANGQTGFPWIDAIMVQLREEGWIHHLARHAVACFLTRGDLWISWEEGMKVFDELLLDADWSVNAGMWMWLSCSSFFQQFFHCYCPVRFGRKTDPNGDFIRKYIPALKNMPTQYIHEPWVAPESVQTTALCRLGKDYPLPMLDHQEASKINIERIKQVYAQLAQFKPQGTIATNTCQRPNINQSSPSPTSLIKNIDQSNYMCNQDSDMQYLISPQVVPSKDSIQQNCTVNSDEYPIQCNTYVHDPSKHVTQVIILPQVQRAKLPQDNMLHINNAYPTQTQNCTVGNQLDATLKSLYKISAIQQQHKQDSFNLKNLITDTYIENYPNAEELTHRVNTNLVYTQQTEIKPNNYDGEQTFDENEIFVQKTISFLPTNIHPSTECTNEYDNEIIKDKTESNTPTLQSMNINPYESMTFDNKNDNDQQEKYDNPT